MELFIKSKELEIMINHRVQLVKEAFPNVEYDEFIVLGKMKNRIILRFYNLDIEEMTYENLVERETEIRKLVEPEFLANFLGKEYKKFGLDLNRLSDTLINCYKLIKVDIDFVQPTYYEFIEEDFSSIKAQNHSVKDIWEIQVYSENVDVLYFTDLETDKYKINKINFYPIKYDQSYEGILKAEYLAMIEETSLGDILIRFQDA